MLQGPLGFLAAPPGTCPMRKPRLVELAGIGKLPRQPTHPSSFPSSTSQRLRGLDSA